MMTLKLASAALALSLFALCTLSGCKKDDAPSGPSGNPKEATDSKGAAPTVTAYSRRAVSCAEIIAGLRDGVGNETVAKGTWGNAPKEMQVLPPGAELCGSDIARKTPVIKSALFGDALGDFYKPIAASMGCTWKGVEIQGNDRLKTTQVGFKCPQKAGGTSLVHTDSGSEFYHISF